MAAYKRLRREILISLRAEIGVYIIGSRGSNIKVKVEARASLLLLISRYNFITIINK